METQSGAVGEAFRRSFFSQDPGAESVIGLFDFLTSMLFYAKDCQHRYIGANPKTLEEVFGLQPLEQLLGRTDLEFQPPFLPKLTMQKIAAASKVGKPFPISCGSSLMFEELRIGTFPRSLLSKILTEKSSVWRG